MARNGSGQFDLLVNTWNPAISGTLAAAGDWQALINDVAAAITQSVSRDGQSPMIGNLPMGNNKVTGVAAGTGTGEALAFQQLFSQGVLADIASAATTDIGVQNTNFLRVTGNTTITSFGTNYRGPRFLVFESALTLTNSSTLVLPGGANLAVTAGDALIAIPGATLGTSDKWIVVAYRKNAIPLETALTATASGNLGLGVTPSAWGGSARAFESLSGTALYNTGTGPNMFLGANHFYNGSNFIYKTTSAASAYSQVSGAHAWYTAPSGTAGNAISFTQAMTLDASGNLGIGTSSPAVRLHANVNSASEVDVARFQVTNGADFKFLDIGADATNNFVSFDVSGSSSGAYVFRSGGTERMRLDSSGNLGLGVTPSAWGSGKAIELGQVTGNALWGLGINSLYLTSNARWNGSNYVYTNNGAANLYGAGTGNGTFTWFTAPSGTAGNAISFTQAMTLDASGRLNIGTTASTATLSIRPSSDAPNTVQLLGDGNVVYGSLGFDSHTGGGGNFRVASNNAMTFLTNGSERARIDTSGRLLLNTTSAIGSGWLNIEGQGRTYCATLDSDASSGGFIGFTSGGTAVGNINTNGTTTSYVTSSDYRLKEAVQPMTGALAKVAALKPCTYKWKVDGSDGEGFIAHELQEVCPDAVTGEKDAVNEDGSIKPQGIDTSFLVATLTAAIQELKAEFDAYKATHP